MKRFLVFIFVVLSGASFARKQGKALTDSLLKEVAKETTDSIKISVLYEVSCNFAGNEPNEGLKYGKEALELAQKAAWPKGISLGNNALGINYASIGDYPKAIDYDFKAIQLAEEAGNKNLLKKYLCDIGLVYFNLKDYEKGLENYTKAENLASKDGDKKYMAKSLMGMSNCSFELADYMGAQHYIFQALKNAEALGDKYTIVICQESAGRTSMKLSAYGKAIAAFNTGLEISQEQDDQDNIAKNLGNIGECYLDIVSDTSGHVNTQGLNISSKKESLAQAISYLSRAIEIADKKGYLDQLQSYYGLLAEAQSKAGNYKDAFLSHKLYTMFRDSVFSQENMKKINMAEGRRDAEVKEQQIKLQQLQLVAANNELRYYVLFITLLVLLFIGLIGRFYIVGKNKRQLEEKNKLIAEEKENADMLRVRAERSEQFKQQFLANMSHEIRTPMNAVNGMTDILLDKNPRPDQLHYLQVISKSSDILLHIINDILDLSKIEVGKLELEAIDFSLTETVKQVKETLSFKAEEKGLHLLTTIDEKINDVLVGDPYRLNQVLINLGGNAIKFTDRGSVEIKMSFVKEIPGKVTLKFAVIDTGKGIPEDKINSLFESFKQVNNSDTRKYGGTGLGLSISKQLVELHGGQITVESKVGVGTSFSFLITYPEGSKDRLNERRLLDQHADASMLNGLRILLTDDNEFNRLVVTETLNLKAKVTIDEADNGLNAIKLLEKNDYDVVLMDVQMPEMDGYEATKYIREKMPYPKNKIPVIALTAGLLRSDIEMCMAHGMNTYVTKPFKVWQLVTAIAEQTAKDKSAVHSPKKAEDAVTPVTVTAPITAAPTKPTTPVSSNPILVVADLGYLTNFCDGNVDKMKKYIKVFLNAVPVFNEKITNAIKDKNNTELALQVHSFKPKWMMMGMKQSTELSQRIEVLCKDNGDETKIASLCSTLLDQNARAAKELTLYVNGEDKMKEDTKIEDKNKEAGPVTSMSFFETFTKGNKEQQKKYIGIFLDTVPGLMSDINKALEEGDSKTIRTKAHSLRPQLTYGGVKEDVSQILQIEQMATDEVAKDTLEPLVKNLEQVCRKAVDEMKNVTF